MLEASSDILHAARTAQANALPPSSKPPPRTKVATLDASGLPQVRDPDPVQAQMLAMLTSLQKKLDSSEDRTTKAIGQKIDGLGSKLAARIDKGEREMVKMKESITNASKSNQELRDYVNKKLADIPALITKSLEERTADECRPPLARTLRRPRTAQPDPWECQSTSAADRYWESRRSLRIYPVVPGENLEASVLVFMARYLKIPADRTCDLTFSAKSLPDRPNKRRESKVHDEVLLIFESVDQRDEVKGYARNLQGQSEAGLNLDVPYHLRPSFAALRDLAYKFKLKNPEFRRNIRLDDRTLDVVMDFTVDQEKWTTVTPLEAKRSLNKRKRKSCTQQEIDEAIGTSDVEDTDDEL